MGASAGGLEALSELLKALPERIGASIVVVQREARRAGSACRVARQRQVRSPDFS
ncbi:MAG: chemotaxis protein CheB [Gammaproteobacteria bacterium]